jgi:hypothetical protein
MKQKRSDATSTDEIKRLYKENANLFNDYAKILEIKEREKMLHEKEKDKLIENTNVIFNDIEEQKRRADYKAKLLENENVNMFNEYLKEYKNK